MEWQCSICDKCMTIKSCCYQRGSMINIRISRRKNPHRISLYCYIVNIHVFSIIYIWLHKADFSMSIVAQVRDVAPLSSCFLIQFILNSNIYFNVKISELVFWFLYCSVVLQLQFIFPKRSKLLKKFQVNCIKKK